MTIRRCLGDEEIGRRGVGENKSSIERLIKTKTAKSILLRSSFCYGEQVAYGVNLKARRGIGSLSQVAVEGV